MNGTLPIRGATSRKNMRGNNVAYDRTCAHTRAFFRFKLARCRRTPVAGRSLSGGWTGPNGRRTRSSGHLARIGREAENGRDRPVAAVCRCL